MLFSKLGQRLTAGCQALSTLRKILTLATVLALATPVNANQYATFDYHVQQMIIHALAKDQTSVQTFGELLENLRRPESGNARQAQPARQQGQEHLAHDNLKGALAAFRQAFIADPTDPDIAGQLALTYLRLNRLEEAERLSVYTLYLAPNHAPTWLTLGRVYGQTGDAQRATGALINAYYFADQPPQLTEQLRQLATTDKADAVRIAALQALQSIQAKTAAVPSAPKSPKPPATASPAPASNDEIPRQLIYQRAIPLTCLIVTFQNGKTADLGSGFLVSPKGLVITNNHVIEKADNLAVRCGDQESTARVQQRSKTPDLALLATMIETTETLKLNITYNRTLVGRDVFVIGNPYGLEGTFSKGIISGLREIDGVRHIQISAPVSPGNSGGPVILRDGTVIGIATLGSKIGQSLNFAIAAVEIVDSRLLDSIRVQSR